MPAGQAHTHTIHYQQLALLLTLENKKVRHFVSMDQDRSLRTQATASAAKDGASAANDGASAASDGARPIGIPRSPQQRRFVEAHLRMDTNTSHKPINSKVPGLRNSKLIRLKESRRITTRRRNQRYLFLKMNYCIVPSRH